MRLLNKAFEWLGTPLSAVGCRLSAHSLSAVGCRLSPLTPRTTDKRQTTTRAGLCLALVVALAAPAAHASTGSAVVAGGGEVSFENATTNWVANADGGLDFVMVFSKTNEAASFTLPGMTSMRVLAVGGGGGGGAYTTGFKTPRGGGAGGGGGGFVEWPEKTYDAGTFSIKVGEGGKAGSVSTVATAMAGGPGGDTTIVTNDVPMITAYGGGGGGAESDGGSGASGGGGSQANASGGTPKAGGTNLVVAVGQGCAGGAGDAALYGGGGGGAGAAGAAASATGGGKGGDGRPSDITGVDVWYAGGGGGGWSSSSTTVPSGLEGGIAGGLGGGGAGGVARNKNINAQPGVDGLGGGGGGANGNATGSARGGAVGGCGVVIVRISGSLDGPLVKPSDAQVEYDGQPHNVVAASPFVTIEGENAPTDVGVYTVKVTPIPGVVWADSGKRETVTVTLTIYEKDSLSGTVNVTGAPVSFYGAAETNWVTYVDTLTGETRQDLLLVFTNAAAFKLPGSSAARILAIGGGGGGGGAYTTGFKTPRGGGAGGGGGGFLEKSATYGAGTYAITVGAGGKAGSVSTVATAMAGGPGGDTTIITNGVPMITAYGGGGGGAESDGGSGASGGGGSQANASGGTPKAGGTNLVAAVGQGYAGGAGDVALYGGGGGGAGGPGGDASTSNPTGGVGRVSNITGVDVWYAGGGGGGWSSSSTAVPAGLENGIAGGLGGGGAGGVARNKNINAQPGVDGLGGGGGGANGNNTGTARGGAKGGAGVVIVRISSAYEGEFVKPATEYDYVYDTTKHTSVTPNVFYDVVGAYAGTTAGVYRAVVKLHEGVSWPDGGDEDLDVTMTIRRLPTTITELSIADWTFHDETTPDPTLAWTTDPAELHDLPQFVIEYGSAAEDGGSTVDGGTAGGGGMVWSDQQPTHAGEYFLRARCVETNNFDCAEKVVPFKVKKLVVTFTNLQQLGWMEGTPIESTPKPSCEVIPEWVPKIYEYKVEGEGEDTWVSEKPTTIGEHTVRVRCLNDTDYDYNQAEATFVIMKGLGAYYRDYVEINIGIYAKPTPLTNFPLIVKLSEDNPLGFLYSRAGTTGDDLSITDATGDNILPYELIEWNTNGVSQLYVRIPELSRKSQKIRLYWYVRDGVNPPSHEADKVWEDWTKEDWDKVAGKPVVSYQSPVSRDGKFVDVWTLEPEMSKTFWDTYDADADKGVITQPGTLKFNTAFWYVTNLVTGVVYEKPADDFPKSLEGGIYWLVYELRDETGAYEPTERHVDFTIHGHTPWEDLKGGAKSVTLAGRVLLANDDCETGYEITDQSYWQTREVVTNATTGATMTNDVFWIHGNEEHGYYQADTAVSHMFAGTTHKLCYADVAVNEDGEEEPVVKTLWRLQDVIIGNTLRITTSGGSLYSMQSILPWSATGLGTSSYENRNVKGDMIESSSLILRNMASAVIYSPCYTNGLGTLYFDAVNSDSNDFGTSNPYRLVVDIATETEDHLPPTDENANDPDRSDFGGELAKITNKEWQPQTIQAFYFDGTSFGPGTEGAEAVLANATGKSTNRFYRVVVPINVRGPVRFRIRRAAYNTAKLEDIGSLILVDNIVVSYPQMGADMVSCGVYDKERKLDRTLGWANAMVPPFPALTDQEIFGRGQPVTYVNASTNANPAGFIQRSTMYYRWRYLDQAYFPANEAELAAAKNGEAASSPLHADADPDLWIPVTLEPGDDFVATKPLVLPQREGDIEYWFESLIDVPYYKYHDYSGVGTTFDKYTEDRSTVTNRLSDTQNWFVRYRPGRLANDAEGYRLFVRESENGPTNVVELSVYGNRTLRGYYQTLEPVTGGDGKGLYVRFEEYNRQVAGSTGYATNVTTYALASDIVSSEEPGTLVEADSNTWSRVSCDAKTGYLLFQIVEDTRAVMVVHADRQNFNDWSDANRADRRFVGTSTYTNATDGTLAAVSARVRTFDADLNRWHLSNATNKLWTESFKVDATEMQKPGGTWEVYQPFSEKNSPNGLNVGPGQWVTGNYRDFGTGMALQMEGCGKGYIQFVNSAEAPRGLESIKLNVRLAQAVEFGDFAYRAGDTLDLTNYTFFCRGAYDVFKRTSFAGNASLSLVACYRAGEGAYELRVEQDNATYVGDTVTGPGSVQRLTLYRWNYDDETGEVQKTKLGETTISNGSTLTTDGEKGNYGLLFISVKNTGTATEICSGVSTGCAKVDSVTATSCKWLSYIDDSADRIENGTYGVLSANCAARFRYLNYCSVAQTCPTTKKQTPDARDATFTFPDVSKRTLSQDDISKGGWVNTKRRMVPVSMDDGTYFGLAAKEVSQSVKVYVGESGSSTFTESMVLTNVTISNFGSIDPIVLPLWTTKDCSVKVATGGTATSMRNDIVIDDLEFRQWRGESYDDKEGAKYFDDLGYGSPTNFVFTYAWNKLGHDADGNVATNCEFNAKRSRVGEAISIRSPLFDGGGDAKKGTARGLGLGMFSFTYANAHPNVNLILQVATNNVSIAGLASITKSLSDYDWQTITNWDFKNATADELKSGYRSCYLGYHGVKGTMRLLLDPKLTESVTNATDEANFGVIDITGVLCKDEPNVDQSSWWGWNVRTTDEQAMRNLWDETPTGLGRGLGFALNNAVDSEILEKDEALYPRHLPFLQTPTFKENVVGEVFFKARKYVAGGPTARVTLFGASDGAASDDLWTKVTSWDVTNDVYETYTYRTKAGQSYAAFRFVVTGVDGVESPKMDDKTPLVPAQRVLLDDVIVLEAIRARVAFRNVAAFRGYLDTNLMVQNVTDKSMQPLCNESFSVQGELFAAQLADEVDLSTATIELWWYVGDSPWGFDRWQSNPKAKHATLAECDGTNLVFRGSYLAASDAVIPEEDKFTAVQYMLVAKYKNKDGSDGESYLSEMDWKNPSWYSPVDYNATKGGVDAKGKYQHFSAYTLLDTVAAGWAWINEVNIFGEYDRLGFNSDKALQFVEIAAPVEADLSKWKVLFLDGVNGSGKVITNTAATFGLGGPAGLKDAKFMDPESKCVFHVIASPEAKGSLSAERGEIDATWRVTESCTAVTQTQDGKGGEILSYYPIAIQLVRPSGVVEHEIVASGTNRYAHLEQYNPEKKVDFMKTKGCNNIFYVGQDNGGIPPENAWSTSLGAMQNNGAKPANVFEDNWSGAALMTPGQRNVGQDIAPEHPQPLGSSIRIYALVEGDHVWQTFGDGVHTNAPVTLIFKKGSDKGTNITYDVDRWYVPMTTNGVPTATGERDRYVLEVGKGLSNNVTVVAKAVADPSLAQWIGPDNRYEAAIVDWLSKGRTFRGTFANPDFTEPGIGDFYSPSGHLVTNLDLTMMYWLDMDPSYPTGVMSLRGGMADGPGGAVSEKIRTFGGRTMTNRLVHVTLAVTNTESGVAWAPYVIRDAVPGLTSWDYASDAIAHWTNASFKVTGILINSSDLSGLRNYENWRPLRWFVFDGQMVGDTPYSKSFDMKNEAEIEIMDPYQSVPMWQNWVESHGGDKNDWPIWHRWHLDNRMQPVTVEILKPSSPL